jgi:acyl-ACP thioesterase
MIYTFDSRIRYSEIDHRETLTLPGLINYYQDCSTFQSEDIGYGILYGKEHNRAWVLSYWQIVIDRYPKIFEQVTTGTFATGMNGLLAGRNFFMKDADGTQISCANSLWVYMNLETGRPMMPDEKEMEAYGFEPKLPMEYEGRRIRPAAAYQEMESFPVCRHHIDTNEHVNNGMYVQMALELLPRDRTVRQVRVAYKKSAVLGDMICPKLAEEDGRTVIELCSTDGSTYAVVELKF